MAGHCVPWCLYNPLMRAAAAAAAASAPLYVHVCAIVMCRGAAARRTADDATSSVSASPSTPLRPG
jgi:hypothetical protein